MKAMKEWTPFKDFEDFFANMRWPRYELSLIHI